MLLALKPFALIWSIATIGAFIATSDAAEITGTVSTVRVVGNFVGENGAIAQDLSGIACTPAAPDGARQCLVVNDEGHHAQWANFSGGSLKTGELVDLVGLAGPSSVGPPDGKTDCPAGLAPPAKAEVDGEAVAYAAPYFYVIGSHGCSRHKGRFSPNAFRIYRVSAEGGSVTVLASTRVLNGLRNVSALSPYLERALGTDENGPRGLNIEGLALKGKQLFVGLRAPMASVVAMNVDDVFAPGSAPLAKRVEYIPLNMGPDKGVRDLTTLPDGRLLALIGPAQEQVGNYGLSLFSPDQPTVQALSGWNAPADPASPKAEGLFYLGQSNNQFQLFIVYDGASNGALGLLFVDVPQ